MSNEITQQVTKIALYMQLAEEAAELSEAASKMARKLEGSNPTPYKDYEIAEWIVEEYSDVELVAALLNIAPSEDMKHEKLARWKERLEKR